MKIKDNFTVIRSFIKNKMTIIFIFRGEKDVKERSVKNGTVI